jgi:RNA polymerase sigma-70 factor (ECF subfamily)
LLFTDKANFKVIFNEHYNALCNYIFYYLKDAVVAEDIVQETFLHLWERNQELEKPDSLDSFIYRSCKNKAIEYIRSLRTYNKHISEAALNDLTASDPVEVSSQYKRLEALHGSLRHLPPKCRQVFELHKFKGLTYAEIAEAEGISVNTVENHMVKAMKLLRNLLSDNQVQGD